MLRSLLILARPHQWIKHVFILLPIPFALADGARLDVQTFLSGLFGFALISSGVYAMNDVFDRRADLLHPTKRNRPVASGAVPVPVASVFALALVGVGLALVWRISGEAFTLTVVYILMNVAYSSFGRSQALLDVFLLSSGFVLRALFGCALVAAPASSWLLLCVSALALFLTFGKRRADLLDDVADDHRGSLGGYDEPFLRQAMTLTGTTALLSYCLYTLDSPVLTGARALAPAPFVAYGILHYLRAVQVEGVRYSPVEMIYRSPTIQLCALGWTLSVLWALGYLG